MVVLWFLWSLASAVRISSQTALGVYCHRGFWFVNVVEALKHAKLVELATRRCGSAGAVRLGNPCSSSCTHQVGTSEIGRNA